MKLDVHDVAQPFACEVQQHFVNELLDMALHEFSHALTRMGAQFRIWDQMDKTLSDDDLQKFFDAHMADKRKGSIYQSIFHVEENLSLT